jgi:4-hydroxy-tetrahydrodipicolinate reductase
MKVVLVGYGRMGLEIEAVLKDRGHEVIRRIDALGNGDSRVLDDDALAGADGVIEFALADGILDRVAVYARTGKSVVIGTTGWDELAEEGRKVFEGSDGALLRGSNFSIGAHLFFRLSAAAARLINKTEEYDAVIVEHHHNKKADYPSGTALTAAEGVLKGIDRKNHVLKNLPEGPIPADALQVASIRVGSVPGVHELILDSPADSITVRHEARSRGGFALGAVRGLEWLKGKKGWHEADAFIDDLLTGAEL